MKALQVAIFTLLLASAFGELLDNTKEWLKDAWDSTKASFGKLKDSAKETIGAIMSKLPDGLQKMIRDRDMSEASEDDLEKMKGSIWDVITPKTFSTIKPEILEKWTKDRPEFLPMSAWNKIRDAFADSRKEEADVIEALGMDEMLESQRLTLVGKLGDSKDWDKAKGDKLDRAGVLKQVPMRVLAKIKNEDLLKMILDKKNTLNVGGTFGIVECPMQYAMHGTPKTWNETLLESTSISIPDLLKDSVHLVSPRLLNMTRKRLGQKVWPDSLCRVIALKILEGNDSASNTKAQNKELISDMGSLRKCLLPGDLPRDKLEDGDWNTLDDNRKTRVPTPKSAMELLKEKLKTFSWNTVTPGDWKQLGGAIAELPPRYLKTATTNADVAMVDALTEYFETNNGPTVEGKVKLLGPRVYAVKEANVPDVFVPGVPVDKLKTLSPEKAKKVAKNNRLTYPQALIVAEKMNPKDMEATTSLAVKEQVPLETTRGWSVSELRPLALFPFLSSPAAILYTEAVLNNMKNFDASYLKNSDLPILFGPSVYNKTKPEDIDEVLMKSEDIVNFDVACLQKKLYCKRRMEMEDFDDCEEVGKSLKPVDVSVIHPCTVACFGTDVIKSLDDESKIILASRNSQNMLSILCIPARTRQVIAEEALKAVGGDKGDMIPEGILADFYANVFNLEGDNLRRIPQCCAANFFLKELNDMMLNPSAACLDTDQRNAVAELIKDKKGRDPSKWNNICDIPCLLPMLTSSDIDKIPDEVLTACSCEIHPTGYPKTLRQMTEATCMDKISMSDQEKTIQQMKDLTKKQKEKALKMVKDPMGLSSSSRRRKRQADSVNVCDEVTILGISSVSEADLKGMTDAEVIDCLGVLGFEKMDMDKAKVILDKVVKIKGGIDKLNNEDLLSLGYALRAITKEQVKNLQTLAEPSYDGTVVTFGYGLEMPADVCKEVADKVKKDWKKPADMSGDQIKKLGDLICCMTTDDIKAFKIASLKEALPGLRRSVTGCPNDISNAIGKRIGEEMGETEDWDQAMVAELGPLLGLIAPEKLMKIPGEAFESLPPDAVKNLSNDHIKALTEDQLKNIPSLAAKSFSNDQINALPEDLREIIESKKSSNMGGGADFRSPVPWSVLLLALSFAFFA